MIVFNVFLKKKILSYKERLQENVRLFVHSFHYGIFSYKNFLKYH